MRYSGSRGCDGLFLQMRALWGRGQVASPWPCGSFLTEEHKSLGITVEAYCPLSCSIWSSSAETTTSTTVLNMTTAGAALHAVGNTTTEQPRQAPSSTAVGVASSVSHRARGLGPAAVAAAALAALGALAGNGRSLSGRP